MNFTLIQLTTIEYKMSTINTIDIISNFIESCRSPENVIDVCVNEALISTFQDIVRYNQLSKSTFILLMWSISMRLADSNKITKLQAIEIFHEIEENVLNSITYPN